MNVKRYDTTFLVKMTKKQKERLMAKATKLGISGSEFIRQMIL